jgi:AhpD family alkylhydroperoxidase
MSERLNWAKAAPGAYKAMLSLHDYLEKQSGLEKELLDLLYLRVSQINGCAFCIDMHWKDLRSSRISEAHLYLLNAWREAPGYSPRERAALEWAEAVTKLTNQDVPDETYRVVREQFTETEVANLTLAIVAINGWNRLSISFHKQAPRYELVEPVMT